MFVRLNVGNYSSDQTGISGWTNAWLVYKVRASVRVRLPSSCTAVTRPVQT